MAATINLRVSVAGLAPWIDSKILSIRSSFLAHHLVMPARRGIETRGKMAPTTANPTATCVSSLTQRTTRMTRLVRACTDAGSADCLVDFGMRRYYFIFAGSRPPMQRRGTWPLLVSCICSDQRVLEARDSRRPLARQNAHTITGTKLLVFLLCDRD